MFVKQAQKTMLQGNFVEAIRVKKDLASMKVNQGNDKPSTPCEFLELSKYRLHKLSLLGCVQQLVKLEFTNVQ